MNLLENFKLDKWYKLVLYLGMFFIATTIIFEPEFIENGHLFGLGLGLILIGLSFWISQKLLVENIGTGLLKIPIIKFNFYSTLLLIIGLLCSGFFLFKIFWQILLIN